MSNALPWSKKNTEPEGRLQNCYHFPDSKVHGANMGPTWVLSAPDGPHVGPMNLAIRVGLLIEAWSVIPKKKLMGMSTIGTYTINTLRPRQDGCQIPDEIFKCIFLNETIWTSIEISLKFVPKGPINNIPSLVQIMVWRWPGDKPLSEPVMVSLLTNICVMRSSPR